MNTRSQIKYDADMTSITRVHARAASRLFGLSVLAPMLLVGAARADGTLRIAAPTPETPVLEAALDDLERVLGIMTARPTERADADAAIRLRLVADDSAGPLGERSREAYHLGGEPDGPVTITARTESALSHGVYGYLRELGVEWLMPGANWEVIPARERVDLAIDTVYEPGILTRRFFCNGGFGGRLGLDRDMTAQADWRAWMRRQGYGGPEHIGGHAGEVFNQRHRQILEANPEMLALVDGQRVAFGPHAKHCVTNEALMRLYVEDRINELARRIARDPDDPNNFAISAEPADGPGHCECGPCTEIGDTSERVFHVVNQVAGAVAERFPDRYASVFAYNLHAKIPEADLHPNVFVMVAPYAFQLTGLRPESLLEAWADKTESISVYGYWANTDWSFDLPSFSAFDRVEPQVRHWLDLGVRSVLMESTASGGAMGFNLWAASRMMWGDDRPIDELLDAYCALAFGDASGPMRRMMGRWAEGFLLADHELGLVYRDLAEAETLTSDPAVLARLDDFKRYAHFLRLTYEYRALSRDDERRRDAAGRLFEHVWRIYESRMVHSYRLVHLTMYGTERQAVDAWLERWPIRDAAAPIWSTVEPYDTVELNALMVEGAALYKPRDFEARRFGDKLVALRGESRRVATRLGMTSLFTGPHDFAFRIDRAGEPLTLTIQSLEGRGDYPGGEVRVVAPDGTEVGRTRVPDDRAWHSLAFGPAKPGVYRVEVFDQGARFRFKLDPNTPMSIVSPATSTNLLQDRWYFYVPKGQRTVALYEQSDVPLAFFDGDGEPIDPGNQRGLIVLPVADGQDGRVWSLTNYASSHGLRMLNVPQVLGWSPAGLVVPAEVAPQH